MKGVLRFALLGFFLVSLAQSVNGRALQEVERFLQIVKTTLAPVYGPLAEQIVSDYDLAEFQGVGIDLGSGPGNLIIELCKRTERMHWINADINPAFFPFFMEMVETEGFKDRASAIRADAIALPFHDNYADILVSRGSIQFWADKAEAIREINRVLKPGGVAFIGRGFSANLPVEVARQIRDQQRQRSIAPKYDLAETVAELKRIVTALAIEDHRVLVPKPPGAEGVSYGVWLEFRKPRERQTRPPRLLDHPDLESAGLETSTTIVTRDDIEKQGAKTVVDALRYVPGSWTESRGRKVKQFLSVRGQRYPYPEYSVDGALFREFHEVPYFFSAADVERVEILRSGAAMLTGTTGLTGVINIVPREHESRETTTLAEYGGLNTYRLHLSHGDSKGGFSYGLGVDGYNTDGPEGRHGSEQFVNLFANADWDVTHSLNVRASVFHIHGERELVQAVPPAAGRFRTALQSFDPIQTTVATVRTLFTPSDRASTQVIVGFSDRRNDFVAESAQEPGSRTTSRDWDHEWSVNAIQAVALSESNVVRVGANYNHWVAPYGKRFYSGRRSDLETFSLTAVDEQRIGRLLLDGGVRYQRTYINEYGAFNIDGSARGLSNVDPILDQWDSPVVSGSLGAMFELTEEVSLHGNVVGGSLEPRRGTLDVNMQEPLSEQRMMTDLGVSVAKDEVGELVISGFFISQDDALVLSGETVTLDGRILELYENRDQSSQGLEFDFHSRPVWGTCQFFLNLMALRARIHLDEGSVRDEEIPRFVLGSGFLESIGRYDINFFWKYVSSYQSSRFTSPATLQPLGNFHNLNVIVGRSFGSGNRLRGYVEIANLGDSSYSTVVGYPDYGRRVLVGIRQRF